MSIFNQFSDLMTHCIPLFQLTLVMVFINAQWPLDGVLTLYQHDHASNTDLLNQMIRCVTTHADTSAEQVSIFFCTSKALEHEGGYVEKIHSSSLPLQSH